MFKVRNISFQSRFLLVGIFYFSLIAFSFAQLKLYPLKADRGRNATVKHLNYSNATARLQAVTDSVNPGISIQITEGYNPRCKSETNLNLTFKPNYFNAGTSPVFEWFVNGVLVNTGSVFSSNTLQDKDTVQCKFTSNLPCVKNVSVFSNKIGIAYADTLTPLIEITALDKANVACSSKYPITIVSSIQNAGVNPQIKWFYNGSFTGITDGTFTKDSTGAGDFIYAVATSNSVCAFGVTTVTSDYINKSVPRVISPKIFISLDSVTNANCGVKTFNFTIDASNKGLNPLFIWYINGAFAQTSTSVNFSIPLSAIGDEVWVNMNSSIDCANLEITTSNILQRADTLNIPFFEDFSGYSGQPGTNHWIKKGGTYVNNTYAIGQPTYNIATFDGLQYDGTAYDTINLYSRGVADNLTSLPIDLSRLSPLDQNSTWLSFFWQPKGEGEAPDSTQLDDLTLYFKSKAQEWIQVWQKKGLAESIFRRENIQILSDSNQFYHNSFQFKFESRGRLSGSFDVWNLDYLYLNTNRYAADTFFLDQSYSKPPVVLLNRKYTSMPFSHFSLAKNSLADSALVSSTFNNLDKVGNNNTFNVSATYRSLNDTLSANILTKPSQFTPGNAYGIVFENTIPGSYWQSFPNAKAEVEYTFSLTGDVDNSDGKHIDYTQNNTLKTKTILDNFYAYDDGSAEYGIGLNQKYAALLYRFVSFKKPDTLRQLAFNIPQLGAVLVDQSFNLIITTNFANMVDINNSVLPANVLYNSNHPIEYAKPINNWTVYDLNTPVIINVDTFYVGYKQITDDEIAIGFDKNTNSSNQIFYNINNVWEPYTDTQGSLLIRPVFGYYNYTLGTKENQNIAENLVLFPMPVEHTLQSNLTIDHAFLYDLQGQLMKVFSNTKVFDLTELNAGLYILKVETNGKYLWKKVVKQ